MRLGGAGLWGSGGLEADCLDIWVHSGILDEPLASGSGPFDWPRQPFWRDERGLHVAWAHSETTSGIARPVHLVISSFDPATAEPVRHRVYDPWPPEVVMGGMSVFAVAGAPDGSFAAAIGYGDAIFVARAEDLDDAASVRLGPNAKMHGRISVPAGTMWIQQGTTATGTFLGKHVRVGPGARVAKDPG